MTTIFDRVTAVRERVARAAVRVGRPPEEVTIVAVSKTQPATAIRDAVSAGLRHFGENYVQEAEGKREELGDLNVVWHMIGHLQRNKAKVAVDLFDVVETVDSVSLGRALDRLAAARDRVLPVLLEVNLGNEDTKAGMAPEAVAPLLEELADAPHLTIRGLMTIPPVSADPESSRPFFRRLRELAEALRCSAPDNAPLTELSMGMTNDFEVAVEEGATLVRVGRAIFGERRLRASGKGES